MYRSGVRLPFVVLLGASLSLLASLPAWSSPLPDTSVVPNGWGVSAHILRGPIAGHAKLMHDLGFRWIRRDIFWDQAERARGVYRFEDHDRFLTTMEQQGLKVMFVLCYGNPLYHEGRSPNTPAARAAFAEFARAMATRYKDRGIIWEIYNEPNNAQFWPPQPNAADYLALAEAATAAILSVDPQAQIVGPGISGPTDGGTFSWDKPIVGDYMRTLLRSDSVKKWSALSVHPYRQAIPETVRPDYERLKQLQAEAGVIGQPLVVTEAGYSSTWGHIGDREQALRQTRLLLTNLAERVNLTFLYTWTDEMQPDLAPGQRGFGVLRHMAREEPVESAVLKPAAIALKELTGVLAGFRFERSLAGAANVEQMEFSDGSRRILAIWRTSGVWPSSVEVPQNYQSAEVLRLPSLDAMTAGQRKSDRRVVLNEVPVFLRIER